MTKFLGWYALLGLLIAGCASKEEPPQKGGVNINVPGVKISVSQDGGAEVNAPGVNVKSGPGGAEVQAPGVNVKAKP